jgi:hypothetical protein
MIRFVPHIKIPLCALLALSAVASAAACGCKTSLNTPQDTTLEKILSASSTPPVFLECRARKGNALSFRFNRSVKVRSFTLYDESGAPHEAGNDPQLEDGTDEVVVTLSKPLEIGAPFKADILVEDAQRNTLNVLAPFRARNDRLPKMLINELRLEQYDKTENKVKVKLPEFIEFIAKSAGNLGALRVFLGRNSTKEAFYEFRPVEVKAGEYIVLHLRTKADYASGCKDEIGSDLTQSSAPDSSNARDFWIPGDKKSLQATDAVYLMDQDDVILDAVVTYKGTDKSATAHWEDKLAAAREILGEQGGWSGKSDPFGPEDAVTSTGCSASRSLCRDEKTADTNSAADWYITSAKSKTCIGPSPGQPNSGERYKAKAK